MTSQVMPDDTPEPIDVMARDLNAERDYWQRLADRYGDVLRRLGLHTVGNHQGPNDHDMDSWRACDRPTCIGAFEFSMVNELERGRSDFRAALKIIRDAIRSDGESIDLDAVTRHIDAVLAEHTHWYAVVDAPTGKVSVCHCGYFEPVE